MTSADHSLKTRIALSMLKGINLSTAGRLLGLIDTPERFFELSESQLRMLTGLDSKATDDTQRARLLQLADKESDFVRTKSITTMFCGDSNYPARLSDCDDAPAMLYACGDREALDRPQSIAVVGTRHATPYGLDFTSRLVADLAEALDRPLIVSGLAYGIDIAAHRAALDAGTPTVAVVAHGLNTIYPAEHRQTAAKIVSSGGALVTEYTSSSPIHRSNFLARNRIVAALADVTVVVESDVRGGAMSTARIASAYNREVMALPGRTIDTYSRGCNELIAKETARIIRSADDLINLMGWMPRKRSNPQKEIVFELTDEQSRIIDFITSHPEATVNDMCAALHTPYSVLSATLFEMEMSNLIMTLPGGHFVVIAR